MHIEVKGYEDKLYIPDTLAANLQRVKVSVSKKGWDYVAVVAGLPGAGKSTFAQALAKFLDPDFESWQICFTGREFRHKTINAKAGQAFILDESFADMNTSLSKDPDFVATVSHLQLIRQKRLYLILVLPDFFSLSKNIAIFRSSHLFVPYSEDYNHGDVAVFDRETKRNLYIKGKQYCNYQASPPNFRCDFNKKWFCDEQDYLQRKDEHLKEMSETKEKHGKASLQRDMIAALWQLDTKITGVEMANRLGKGERQVEKWIQNGLSVVKWDKFAHMNPKN